MRASALVAATVSTALGLMACGGSSADDVAKQLDNAINSSSYGQKTLNTADGGTIIVREADSEVAAESATCQALGTYNSEASGAFQDYLTESAQQQQVVEQITLQEVDSNVVDALADNADEIESASFAAEVAENLGCRR